MFSFLRPTKPLKVIGCAGNHQSICIFIGNHFGCWYVCTSYGYLHFQLKENQHLYQYGLASNSEARVPGLPFWITAFVAESDFMQTRSIVFVVYWYFPSQNTLQSHCNFANPYMDFAYIQYTVHYSDTFNVDIFFSSSRFDFFPFKDLLPNW